MKPHLHLVAAPLALFLAPVADDLSFHPQDDSRATRRYTIDAEIELDDISVMVDGQDFSEMVPDFDGSASLVMKVTDHFVRTVDGRPLELIRSFVELTGEAEAMGESQDMDGFSDLEGKQVRFAWSEEDEEYLVSFHECEGDEADLEDLSVDMDLRALLPRGEVDEGDTWTVEASRLASVLLFGSEPDMDTSDGDEMDQLFEAEIVPQLEALLEELETSCRYEGTRTEGERRVGVVAVTMNGEGTIDLAGLIQAAVEMQAGEIDVALDIAAAELSLDFSATGEMLWDLQAGRLHGFQLGGDVELGFEVDVSADAEGETHELSGDGALLGRVRWKVEPGDGG